MTEFRLVFRGEVPPRRRATIDSVHQIRRILHPQLKKLWEFAPIAAAKKYWRDPTEQESYGLHEYRKDRLFIPVVSARVHLVGVISVLLFRQQAAGQLLYEGGDLDNRVKTLLDALRVPSEAEAGQIAHLAKDDEEPFFCVLQDDALVTKLTIDTDRLLEPAPPNQVLAIIHVHVRASRPTMGNSGIAS